jgi:cellulose biosynthesis protein BcsQ
MIVALLNQPHGVGKMTLALHPAGLWSYRTRHVTVIDADPQGRTLEWSEMRAQERLPRRFTVIGLTRNTLHRPVNEANTFRPRLCTRIVSTAATRTTSMPMRLHKRSPSVIRRC